MRIIAGTARGRRLLSPQGGLVRPTPDRVREAVFSILGLRLPDAQVADFFAGTGALGLEALSRGAAHALLVDSAAASCELCRKNAERLGMTRQVTIVERPALAAIAHLTGRCRAFDIVFAAPPYRDELACSALLDALSGARLTANEARVVLQHHRSVELPDQVAGFERDDVRIYGITAVSIYVPAAALGRDGEPPPQC